MIILSVPHCEKMVKYEICEQSNREICYQDLSHEVLDGYIKNQ